jgi:hypothetical protein
MNFPRRFLSIGIIVSFLILIILLILSFGTSDNRIIFKSFLFSDLITFQNFVFGLLFILYGIKRSDKIFLISIFGGLILRLGIMLGLVLVCLKSLEINEISFIFSLLFFYIFYAIIEIIYLVFSKKQRF